MGLKSINVATVIFIMNQNIKMAVFTLCRIIYSNNMDWSFPPKYTIEFRTDFPQAEISTTRTEYS